MAGKRPFVPTRTDDPVLTEVQRSLKDALDQLEELRRGMVAFAPKVVASDYGIGEETFVVYNGGGGSKITLPKADALTGKARQICLVNIGRGFSFQLVASGSDTINGKALLTVPAGTMTIAVSDGASAWKCTVTTYAFDLAKGEVGLFDQIDFSASADTNNNTTARFIHYVLNYAGRSVPSNIVGLQITGIETDLGTGSPDHTPLFISVNNLEIFRVKAAKGAARALAKVTGDLQVTQDTRMLGNIGEYGAAAVPQSAHITHAVDLPTAITAINTLLTYLEGRGTVAP